MPCPLPPFASWESRQEGRMTHFLKHLIRERALAFVQKHQRETEEPSRLINLYMHKVSQLIDEVKAKRVAKEEKEWSLLFSHQLNRNKKEKTNSFCFIICAPKMKYLV